MPITVPLALAREQIPTAVTSFAVALRSMTPLRPRHAPRDPQEIRARFRAPSSRLVDAYAAWSGAPAGRYRDVLPPHFCSHWAFAMLARLGGQAPYNLATILNQGLHVQVREPLPRGVDLQLRGRLVAVEDDGKRIRIHSRVIAGFDGCAEAMTLDSYATVPQRQAAKHDAKSRGDAMAAAAEASDLKAASDRKAAADGDDAFATVGIWTVAADDGINFALLTGDFNPIHTLWPLARRTRFRGCILHGFGSVARTWEALHGDGHVIRDIDLRFIKPLPLPNTLEVQVMPVRPDGRRAFRVAGRGDAVHLVGHFA